MKAVEEGLNSESVKERIKALEKEKKHVKNKLFDITANYPEVTKQEVVAWLTGLKSGDIEDKKFQSELFNTFISAASLYDDKRIKIVFGMPGGGKSTENSLPNDIDDLEENVCIGSSTGHHTLIPRMRSTSVFTGFVFTGFYSVVIILKVGSFCGLAIIFFTSEMLESMAKIKDLSCSAPYKNW